MHILDAQVGEEELVYACHVFRSGLLREKAIPRFPVINWLFNELNIFTQETDINTLFPIKRRRKFNYLVELSNELNENTLEQITLKAENKLAKLTYKRISNYFFLEVMHFSVSYICMIFILSFFHPFIDSLWKSVDKNYIDLPNVFWLISCSLTGVAFLLYLLHKVNNKLFESVLLNNVVTILKQAQIAKEAKRI